MMKRAATTAGRAVASNQLARNTVRSFTKNVARRPRETSAVTSHALRPGGLFGSDLLNDFFRDPFFSPTLRDPFFSRGDMAMSAMPLDVSENEKQYVVKAELPGIKKEDVKVSFDDHVLTISCERKEENATEDQTTHYSDFAFGKTTRSIRIPTSANTEDVSATMEDGVLTICLNKVEATKKTIEIK